MYPRHPRSFIVCHILVIEYNTYISTQILKSHVLNFMNALFFSLNISIKIIYSQVEISRFLPILIVRSTQIINKRK
jgi:hypothetical protein